MGPAALEVDLLAPAAVADPYPLLAALRAEDPVYATTSRAARGATML